MQHSQVLPVEYPIRCAWNLGGRKNGSRGPSIAAIHAEPLIITKLGTKGAGDLWRGEALCDCKHRQSITPSHSQVPITLYFMTHAYFCFYHALSNVCIRRARHATAKHGIWAQRAATVAVVFLLSYATAYGETFTIAHFPYYTHKVPLSPPPPGSILLYVCATLWQCAGIDAHTPGLRQPGPTLPPILADCTWQGDTPRTFQWVLVWLCPTRSPEEIHSRANEAA